jgi:hypothetical protein
MYSPSDRGYTYIETGAIKKLNTQILHLPQGAISICISYNNFLFFFVFLIKKLKFQIYIIYVRGRNALWLKDTY